MACSLAACIFITLAAFTCYFVTVNLLKAADDIPLGETDRATNFGFGLWSRESTEKDDYCILWNSTERSYFLDGYWTCGRAFSLLTAVFGIIALLSTCLVSNSGREPNRATAWFYFLVVLCNGLTFLTYNSKICKTLDCSYSTGSTWAVVSAALFFVAGLLHLRIASSFATPKQENDTDDQQEPVEEESETFEPY